MLQVGANILLLVATHVLCICYIYISEIGLRKIFCETKTVVLSRLTIHKQLQKRVSWMIRMCAYKNYIYIVILRILCAWVCACMLAYIYVHVHDIFILDF